MRNFEKYTTYNKTETFATNCTTFLYTECDKHSWINTSMTLQGVHLKKCLNCGKTLIEDTKLNYKQFKSVENRKG